jgi:transcription elongation factor Elf1
LLIAGDPDVSCGCAALSEPVDVYTSWIDACEAENAMEEGDDEFGPTEHSAAAAGTAAAAEVDDGDDL